jgi:hypothetical protein
LSRPGQDEPLWPGSLVYRALHRTEHLRNVLPLVEQQREWAIGERGVGIGPCERRLGRPVKPEPASAMAAARGRLAAGPRANNHDGGMLGKELRQQGVN